MINRRFKTWFIALMLLAFTGQTVSALAMPCEAMGNTMAAMVHDMSAMSDDMSAMDHAMPMNHQMSVNSDKNSILKDCCKLTGHCASGGCSNAGFAHHIHFALVISPAAIGDDYLSVMPATLVSSLFRPPISH